MNRTTMNLLLKVSRPSGKYMYVYEYVMYMYMDLHIYNICIYM